MGRYINLHYHKLFPLFGFLYHTLIRLLLCLQRDPTYTYLTRYSAARMFSIASRNPERNPFLEIPIDTVRVQHHGDALIQLLTSSSLDSFDKQVDNPLIVYKRYLQCRLTDISRASLLLGSLNRKITLITDYQLYPLVIASLRLVNYGPHTSVTVKKSNLLSFPVFLDQIFTTIVCFVRVTLLSRLFAPPSLHFIKKESGRTHSLLLTYPSRLGLGFYRRYIAPLERYFNLRILVIGNYDSLIDGYSYLFSAQRRGSSFHLYRKLSGLSCYSYISHVIAIAQFINPVQPFLEFTTKIFQLHAPDLVLNRQQIVFINNLIVLMARHFQVPVLGSPFEPISDADFTVYHSQWSYEMLGHRINSPYSISTPSYNFLIDSRFSRLSSLDRKYLDSLGISSTVKSVLYAPDFNFDTLTVSERLHHDHLVINYALHNNITLIIKVHSQDLTPMMYSILASYNFPLNVYLISQYHTDPRLMSREHCAAPISGFNSFCFFSCLASCDLLITSHSSCSQDALYLGKKVGILATASRGPFQVLIDKSILPLIHTQSDLHQILSLETANIDLTASDYLGFSLNHLNQHASDLFQAGRRLLESRR